MTGDLAKVFSSLFSLPTLDPCLSFIRFKERYFVMVAIPSGAV